MEEVISSGEFTTTSLKGAVMKKTRWFIGSVGVAVLAGIAIVAFSAEKEKAEPAEKSVTITEKQLNELVERRIAQRMLEDKTTLDDRILKSENWHTAIFNGVEFTVYTGPGQVMATRWVPTPKATLEETPKAPAKEKK